ncbi:hypothetical protein AYI68_g6249 [Smittium mucronatum]|uniref:Uncharacterized protein n=1 Tax=Smittium mucronatum TaxID=133383 RepID=A0A1R0GS25_9FUNG|nr:hypothetical protein AYI68_g6249 [Smittium mucronatum]
MGPEAANIIRELAEKDELLVWQRCPEEEILELFVSIRIPIEEDFFRLPLNEYERKIEIHSCPREFSKNYSPPPQNCSAPVSVMKLDSVLYGIQSALAQVTRPIYYLFHRIIQNNPGISTASDPETYFASTMRDFLSELAATITQAKLDNLYKGIDLPGKQIHLYHQTLSYWWVRKNLIL